MRTWWTWVLTAAMVIVTLPGPVHADAPVTPGWTVSAGSPQEPQGPPVFFNVTGPANATFVLNVNAQPFNWTAPVYQVTANTSATNNSTVGWSVILFPTARFPMQFYQVSVFTDDALVNQTYFTLVLPYNSTNLESDLGELQQQLDQDERSLAFARGQIASQQNTIQWLYWIVLAAVVAMGGIVLYAKYGPNVRSRLHRTWVAVHRFYWSTAPSGYTNTSDDLPPAYVEHPVPDQHYSADYCRDCRGLWSEAALVNHIVQMHPSVYGPAGPQLGEHYRLVAAAVRRERTDHVAEDRRGTRHHDKLARGRRVVPIGEVL